jgi:hypothetical protein
MHTVLIILISIIIIISFVFFYYIWHNRESSNSIDLFIKVAIAFIAALLIILLEVLKPPQNDFKEIKIPILRVKDGVITDEFSNRLLKVSSFQNGYSKMNEVYLFSRKMLEKYDYDKLAIDMVEYSIWVWLSNKYNIHWQMEYQYFEGFAGGGYSGGASEDAEHEPFKLTQEMLQTELDDSYFNVGKNNFWGVMLPSNSTFKYLTRDSIRRIFEIRNRYMTLTFTIIYTGNTGVEHSILGNKITNSLNHRFRQKIDYFTNNIIVRINCNYTSFYKGSPQTRLQRKWVQEVMTDLFNNYDFSILYEKLDKAYAE